MTHKLLCVPGTIKNINVKVFNLIQDPVKQGI